MASRKEGDRHRQLLLGFVEVHGRDRMGPPRVPARGLPADDRFLPRTPVPLRGGRVIPFLNLKPAADAADVRAAIERVVQRGWFVLGPELEAFEQEFAAGCGVAHAGAAGTGAEV